MYKPHGIITALVTPFTEAGDLDTQRLRSLVEAQVGAGIHGIMVCGGSGEFVSLDDGERRQILRVGVEQADGRIPVIMGVLAPSTRHAIHLVRMAKDEGAAAGLILTPYYINPSTDGVVRHFELISEAADLPIILYNNPGRTGINLEAETVAILAQIPTVVGMKECDRDLSRVSSKMAAAGKNLALLSGEDDLAFPTFMLGAVGAIVATSNLAPELMVKLFSSVQLGDLETARAIHFKILPFVEAFYIRNHPSPLKEAMEMAGQSVGNSRPPLQLMTDGQAARMKVALSALERLPVRG